MLILLIYSESNRNKEGKMKKKWFRFLLFIAGFVLLLVGITAICANFDSDKDMSIIGRMFSVICGLVISAIGVIDLYFVQHLEDINFNG